MNTKSGLHYTGSSQDYDVSGPVVLFCVCVKLFAVKLALLRVLIVEVSSDAISCTAGVLHRELTALLTKTIR
jgi:hypothetical protein